MSLLPSSREWDLQLSFIDEAVRLYGIQCKIFMLKKITMYQDSPTLNMNYNEVRVLFEEYVSKRLLANLTWQNKEVDQEGTVVFIPRKYGGQEVNIVRDLILEIYNGDRYRIMEVNKKYIVGLWYIVKVVPFTDEPDRKEVGQLSSFFRSDREEVE